MKKINRVPLLICLLMLIASEKIVASPWTNFVEYPTDPIYNPYPAQTLPEDYFPCVIYNKDKFDGNGDAYLYKMWHQGFDPSNQKLVSDSHDKFKSFEPFFNSSAGVIAVSYSNDGINWTLHGNTNLSPNAYHPFIVYSKNGMFNPDDSNTYFYRAWYWTGVAGITPDVIQYSFSNDGINWLTPRPCHQAAYPYQIVTGVFGTYLYHLYCPGFVIFNPLATSIPGDPYTFPYVMFYDIASESEFPPSINSVETIFLAYSNDGITWTRFAPNPPNEDPILLLPGGATGAWDGNYAYRPAVFKLNGMYHMYYSGSNSTIDPLTTVYYAHGIGHASSSDGINWTRDVDNPVFIYSDGVPWRNSRTYTPAVVFNAVGNEPCQQISAQMWFVGGTGLIAGIDQAIGYATLQPQPLPPICTPNCLLPNTLYLVKKYSHGAPIQSVAWSCPTTDCPYQFAAIGGYKGCLANCTCASIRAYVLDSITENLTEIPIDNPLPTDFVYTVNWCCIPGSGYSPVFLMVGGCPDQHGDSFWAYNYIPDTHSLQPYGKPYAHNGTIYATKCVPVTCGGNQDNFVVIAGQEAHGANIRLLTYDDRAQEFVSLSDALFGETIYSVDVCTDSNGCTLIAVGGKPVVDCKGTSNIRIYKVGCEGILIPVASAYYEGGTVRTLKWCCQADRINPKLWYLVVGGDPDSTGSTIQIYYYMPSREILRPFAHQAQPDKVFGVDWLQGCKCSYLVAGSGCLAGECVPNVFVYNLEKELLPELGVISKKHFDDNITSVASCKIGDVTYVLAGSESNRWQQPTFDPLCVIPVYGNELALFKGTFCKQASLQNCKPVSVCERTKKIC